MKILLLLLTFSVGTTKTFAQPSMPFRDCADCPLMIALPSGDFMMGSPATEPGRYPEEGPQRKMHISAFAAGVYDVTRGEWAEFVSATHRPTVEGCAYSLLPKEEEPKAAWDHLGFPQDDRHPVVCITWQDAQDYVQWLCIRTGAKYRLFSESEWEYADRAKSTTAFPWGAEASHAYANYGADSGYAGIAEGKDQWVSTSPVGSFPANDFGLFDMEGNVLQFTADCFAPSYSDLSVDGRPNTNDEVVKMTGDLAELNGQHACAIRIVRGSTWGDPPRMVRSAFRNWVPGPGETLKNYRSAGLGFRVARTL